MARPMNTSAWIMKFALEHDLEAQCNDFINNNGLRAPAWSGKAEAKPDAELEVLDQVTEITAIGEKEPEISKKAGDDDVSVGEDVDIQVG